MHFGRAALAWQQDDPARPQGRLKKALAVSGDEELDSPHTHQLLQSTFDAGYEALKLW